MGKLWDFESFADSPALIADTGVTLSYRDLARLSTALEDSIGKNADFAAEERPLTMFVCRNSIGALSGYAALMNSGYPMLPLSALCRRRTRCESPALSAVSSRVGASG